MQTPLCCRINILTSGIELSLLLLQPSSSSYPSMDGLSHPVVGYAHGNTFLTCLPCHFGVIKSVEENTVAGGFR